MQISDFRDIKEVEGGVGVFLFLKVGSDYAAFLTLQCYRVCLH